MAWLRIDDAFDAHPKILALGNDQRRYTWIRILIYTCRYRSDRVPPNITHTVPKANARFLNDCLELGLLDINEEGLYVVHDWADYQAGNPKKAARQRRWRNADVDGDVDAYVDAHVDGDVDASRAGARAFPSRPVTINKEPFLPSNESRHESQEGTEGVANGTHPLSNLDSILKEMPA
jgi:hypothetical protein